MEPTKETAADEITGSLGINPGYALGRLAKAFRTSQTHENSETRARAEKKVRTWINVFEGILSGALQIGSRMPLADTPAWATLEVAYGGFATGELLASGAIQTHERELLSKLSSVREGTERISLNSYFLSDAGLPELRRLLESGCYRVAVPEEGVLLVVAWLLERGDFKWVRSVLDEIGPWMSKLRFYPVPVRTPIAAGSVVHLQDIQQTIQKLSAIRVPAATLAYREAVQVWVPLYGRVVELFLETVEGSIPILRRGPDQKLWRNPSNRFVVEGGWPCQVYREGWRARAEAVLEDYRRLRSKHQRVRKPDRAKRNFARLRGYLNTCVQDPRRLTGQDVAFIRQILAGYVTKQGVPNSSDWQQARRSQAMQAAIPTSADVAKVLIDRLSTYPQDEGLNSLDGAIQPITMEEASRHGLKADLPIPDYLARKVRRSLAAPVSVLVELGVISSCEVLARVIPPIAAQIRAAGIPDANLRRLYGAIYTAFRRRRSLLLLNLQNQVQFKELPWVQATEAYRQNDLDEREQARRILEQVVSLAITAFPERILPNKLLQEIRSLAEIAGLKIPIVDELAADIFMGDFSEKFVFAAQKAGELLTGSLYERYYGLSYARVWEIHDIRPSRYGTPTSQAFAQICTELAGSTESGRWSVARNGKIIEQQQILTTHNLAVMFNALGLTETLQPRLQELAERCFRWICRRLQKKTILLRTIKNSAYAWRQMIFFLSLLPQDRVEEFLSWASDYLSKLSPEFQARFRPALEGLDAEAKRRTPENPVIERSDPRRFLGWTTEKHWFLA